MTIITYNLTVDGLRKVLQMNERIQQLEKQCWETRQVTNDAHSWHTSFNTQKFAELIVQECASVAGYYYTRNECVSPTQIKKHFGVEE